MEANTLSHQRIFYLKEMFDKRRWGPTEISPACAKSVLIYLGYCGALGSVKIRESICSVNRYVGLLKLSVSA